MNYMQNRFWDKNTEKLGKTQILIYINTEYLEIKTHLSSYMKTHFTLHKERETYANLRGHFIGEKHANANV